MIPLREEDEIRAHEAAKEQIAFRQERPRFECHVMLPPSKIQTFCLAVWGYHFAPTLSEDMKIALFT